MKKVTKNTKKDPIVMKEQIPLKKSNIKRNIILGISGIGITGLSAALTLSEKKNKELKQEISNLKYENQEFKKELNKKAPFLSFIGKSLMIRQIREKDEFITKLNDNYTKLNDNYIKLNEKYKKSKEESENYNKYKKCKEENDILKNNLEKCDFKLKQCNEAYINIKKENDILINNLEKCDFKLKQCNEAYKKLSGN